MLSLFSGSGASQRRRVKHTVKPKPAPKIVERFLVVNIFSPTDMICGSVFCPARDSSVKLIANSSAPSGDALSFDWNVSSGKVSSNGGSVSWDLKGVEPGVYTATVKVSDQHSGTGTAQREIRVVDCGACSENTSPCPVITVSCPDEIANKNR